MNVLHRIKSLIAPPVFPSDETKTRRARMLNIALTNILILIPILLIGNLLGGKSTLPVEIVDLAAFSLCLVLRFWLHQGKVRSASIGLMAMGFIAITAAGASLGTIRTPSSALFLLLIITAGLLFDLGGMIITITLSSLAVAALIMAENMGLLPAPNYSVNITQWIAYTVIFAWAGSLNFSALQTIGRALQQAKCELTERKFAEAQLEKHRDHLEELVSKRTIELETKNVILTEEIAERKLAEEALKISKEKFSVAFQNIPDAIIITSMNDGIIIEANESFFRIEEFSKEDIIGKTTIDLNLWGSISDRNRFVEELQKYGRVERFETKFRKKSGLLFIGLISGEIIVIQGEKYVLSVVHDITERKQAEEEIHDREMRYRAVVSQAFDAIFLVDVKTKCILEGNISFQEMLGFSSNEILGLNLFDFVAHDHESIEKNIDQIKRLGHHFIGDRQYRHKDGSIIDVEVSSNLIHYGKRDVLCVIARNISERKLAEDTLRETKEYLDKLISYANAPIVVWDPQQRITRFNMAMERLTGYSSQEVLGQHLKILFPNNGLDDSLHIIESAMHGDRLESQEITIINRNGGVSTVLWNLANIYSESGKLQATIAQGQDITERKLAEEALQRNAKRLRNLHKVDQAILLAIESPKSIAETALMHIRNLLSCQQASVQLFDFEKNELKAFAIGVKAKAIMQVEEHPLEDFHGDLQILKQGMMDITEDLAGSPSPSAMTKSQLSEGIHSYINVPLLSGTKLIGALTLSWNSPRKLCAEEKEIAGEVAGQIAIMFEQARLRSETEAHARNLEKRVQERTIELEAANKELEAFSYSVSHDLRAPLRAVDGFSRILLEEHLCELTSEAQHYLDMVRTNAVQMGQLIDDLLTFSRTSRQALTKRPVDMGEIVRKVLEELQGELKGRKANVIIGDLPQCRADPAMLKHVIFNLISNAVKFTRKKEVTEIEIGSINNEGKITYYVKDNGAGFDMNYASKLFGVFQRLHTGSEYEGTGVGLAIVQRIVHRHKGRVWAESEVDKGAKFYFTLEGDESH